MIVADTSTKLQGLSASRVLIVDDAPAVLDLLTLYLRQGGYSVRAAPNGELALRSALSDPPALILLDIKMPRMDGFEVCRQLKENLVTQSVPIIFISGLSDLNDRIRGFEAGGVDFITKPFQREEVLARVHVHIALQQAMQQINAQNRDLEVRVQARTAELAQEKLNAQDRAQALADALVQLHALTTHMHDSIERERLATATDIHDQIGALLTGANLLLNQLVQGPGPLERRAHAVVSQASEYVSQALQSSRGVYARLRPPMLDDLGLVETIRWYIRDWSEHAGIEAIHNVELLQNEPAEAIRMDIFRILQELLTNVARHSGATRVYVMLEMHDHELILLVQDNGVGFDPGSNHDGFGLRGIRGRLNRHQGVFIVEKTDTGLQQSVRIPLGTH